jgi:phosphoglycerate dehydrogenase-like enzyme
MTTIFFDRRPVPEVAEVLAGRARLAGPGWEGWPGAAGAVVGGAHRWGADRFDQNPALRVLVRTGIGHDTVDLDAATARGIAVCTTPDGPTVSTAEHTVALLLAAAKRLGDAQACLRRGEGDHVARSEAVELAGRTLGLVGYGRIGRRVAAVAEALGMRVLVYDPFAPVDRERAGSLDELLAASPVVSLHLPLTPDTRHLLDRRRLGLLPEGAIVVNCARGGLIDTDALLAAVDGGPVAFAALDVTDPEPLPVGHPLLDHPRVLVTPHVGSATVEARRRMQLDAVRAALTVLDGGVPDHCLNPGVLDRPAAPAAPPPTRAATSEATP